MASPRFNQNLSDPLQIGQKGEIGQSARSVGEGPETRAITATAEVDHSQTTASTTGNHSHELGWSQADRELGWSQTSDRLPTERPRTSDTAGSSTGETSSTLGRQLDARLRLRLAQLEVLPGPISGKGVEQTSQGVEKPLPISWSGRAKGVDPESDVYVFRLRIERAHSVKAKAAVLRDLNAARDAILVSRRKGRPEYDLSVKEGRIAAGRLAEDKGVRWACEALGGVPDRTMRRYRDEYRRSQ